LRDEITIALGALPALRAAAARAASIDPRDAIVARVKAWRAANRAKP
jgi:hypothetical protein